MQKIKAASELYIETEKKKREKAYLGNELLGSVDRISCKAGVESHLVGPRILIAGR